MNRIQFNLPPGTNVASASNGATATASSTYSGGGSFPASSVINGDRKGVNWGSGGGWNDDTASTYPDWVQVSFNGSKTINEIDVFTLQDNYASPSEPTEAMTFSQYGIVDFKVQYWDGVGWTAVSGGVVTGNNKVWRKFTFSSLTTDKIRVRTTNALSSYSRVTEIEAYQVATPAYDAAGNVTNDGAHTYEYDSENRIVSLDGGSTASYAYDNQNRRYKKTVGSTVTHYVWQGSHVLAEHNGSTGAVLIDYVYSGSRMIAKVASGVTQYFLSDRLSVRLSLDTSGNITGRQGHLPFGEDFGESGTQQKQHFTSYERDGESGSDYSVNRGYSANLGRFQQADPYRANGYIVDPQSWNRYPYAQNEPVNRLDPIGLDFTGGLATIGSAIANAIGPSIHLYGWDSYPPSGGAGDGERHGPLEDTGDSGGGAVQVIVKNLTPKESAKEFLKAKSGCKKAINDAAASKGLGSIDATLEGATFVYESDLSESDMNMSLRALGFPETGNEAEMLSTLGSHIGLFGKDIALTNYANHKIYLGSLWTTDHSMNTVDSVTTHEALHDLFQGDHKKIAEALGLDSSGTDRELSDRITTWLDGGCKKK